MNQFNLETLLTELVNQGHCPALINDDDGHWYLSLEGFQPIGGKVKETIFFTDDEAGWKDTIREAVEYALKEIPPSLLGKEKDVKP